MLSSFDNRKETSLYIHIPFCSAKCDYCAFYSLVSNKETFDKYTEKLLKEIDVASSYFKKPWKTVFIGGGNPGMVGPKNLLKIVNAIVRNGKPDEFSIEMNPETLTKEYFPIFEIVDRLSMGVQSLKETSLTFLGRNSSVKQTLDGIKLSSQLKIEKSYDLITCLPGENTTLGDIKMLENLTDFNHLSVYALTPEKHTPMWLRKDSLPDNDTQYDQLMEIWTALENRGFSHYEVSNFARNGRVCLHNCRYWQLQQYIGLGSAACSTSLNGNAVRWNGIHSVSDYIHGDLFSTYEREDLSKMNEIEEYILVSLRTKRGIKKKEFYDRFQIDLPVLDYTGFINDNTGITVTDKGLMISDSAALKLIVKTEKKLRSP